MKFTILIKKGHFHFKNFTSAYGLNIIQILSTYISHKYFFFYFMEIEKNIEIEMNKTNQKQIHTYRKHKKKSMNYFGSIDHTWKKSSNESHLLTSLATEPLNQFQWALKRNWRRKKTSPGRDVSGSSLFLKRLNMDNYKSNFENSGEWNTHVPYQVSKKNKNKIRLVYLKYLSNSLKKNKTSNYIISFKKSHQLEV